MKQLKIFVPVVVVAGAAAFLFFRQPSQPNKVPTGQVIAATQGQNGQGTTLSPRSSVVPTTTALNNSAVPVNAQAMVLPSPSPAIRVRQGEQLAQLHRQINALPVVSPKDP